MFCKEKDVHYIPNTGLHNNNWLASLRKIAFAKQKCKIKFILSHGKYFNRIIADFCGIHLM